MQEPTDPPSAPGQGALSSAHGVAGCKRLYHSFPSYASQPSDDSGEGPGLESNHPQPEPRAEERSPAPGSHVDTSTESEPELQPEDLPEDVPEDASEDVPEDVPHAETQSLGQWATEVCGLQRRFAGGFVAWGVQGPSVCCDAPELSAASTIDLPICTSPYHA